MARLLLALLAVAALTLDCVRCQVVAATNATAFNQTLLNETLATIAARTPANVSFASDLLRGERAAVRAAVLTFYKVICHSRNVWPCQAVLTPIVRHLHHQQSPLSDTNAALAAVLTAAAVVQRPAANLEHLKDSL